MREESRTSTAEWPLLSRYLGWERRLGTAALARGRLAAGAYELFRFGVKEGWACLFGGLLLGLIMFTRLVYPAHPVLPRLDFLFGAALLIQLGMLL